MSHTVQIATETGLFVGNRSAVVPLPSRVPRESKRPIQFNDYECVFR